MVLRELYRILKTDDLCLAYSGLFSDEMTDKIIDLSEVYFSQNVELTKLRKRTSFLVAECFQNVVRHGSDTNSDQPNFLSSGSFLIRFRDNKCFIASRNAVPIAKVDDLQEKIQEINKHEKEKLKELYMNVLSKGSMNEKGGAGLGLIEMARKTENKLHYSFEKTNDAFCEFNLMLVLESKEENSPSTDFTSELNSSIDIFKKQALLNQYLLYKGDFGDIVLHPVVDMIHDTMDSISSSRAIRVKSYLAAIEMMHNINYYSFSADGRKIGMITIGKKDESPIISVFYNIRSTSSRKIGIILENFMNASPEDIDKIYKKKLNITESGKTQSNWIGLIELSRISQSWGYNIEDVDDTLSNLGFYVTI